MLIWAVGSAGLPQQAPGSVPAPAGRPGQSATPESNMKFLDVPQSGHLGTCISFKYGLPPANTRIFIETQQQINGWRDIPKRTKANVLPA